jgi:hypothetical protein
MSSRSQEEYIIFPNFVLMSSADKTEFHQEYVHLQLGESIHTLKEYGWLCFGGFLLFSTGSGLLLGQNGLPTSRCKINEHYKHLIENKQLLTKGLYRYQIHVLLFVISNKYRRMLESIESENSRPR